MFNSKFILFTVGVLILCLVLAIHTTLSEDMSESRLNETDDVSYIWIADDDGNVKLIQTTDNHFEGSASAPG